MEGIVGNELWAQVPLGVRPQLEEAWKQHVLEQEAIQSRLKFQFEQELEEATGARTATESQLEASQSRLAESDRELRSAREQLQNLQTQAIKVESEHSLNVEEVKSLRSIRQKLEEEMKAFEEELKKANKDAEDSKNQLKEATLRMQEHETTISSLKHKNVSLEQAQLVLEKRVNALNEDLDVANASAIKTRNNSSKEIAALQGVKEDLTGRLEVANSELERIKTEMSSLRTSLQSAITEKERAEASFITMETQWEAELNAEKRLTEAYKIGEEKYKLKIKQLLDTTNDIQKENSDLSRQNEEAQIKLAGLQSDLKQRESEVNSLKTQLSETRELVSTPTSGGGFDGGCQEETRHPLTILQERNAVDSRVAALQKDNQMLNHTVRQLTKEMEAVTENIVHHDAVYKRMAADRDKLERQLTVLNDERDRLMEERDTAMRESTKLRFSAQRLEKHNDDLSRQVQVLLAQIENRQDTRARDIRESDNLEATVSDVVSTRLVTFTSIAELQEKNSQLLRAVRELESIIEERETDEKRSLELEALVSDLKREVEQLMVEKDCQAEIVSALRSGTTRTSLGRSGQGTTVGGKRQSSGSGGGLSKEDEDPSSDNRENRQEALEIERLSKEIERLRNESSARTTSLENKIESLQSSNCAVKIELTSVKAKLDSEALKARQLDGQLKTAQVEVQSLRDRNISLTANIASYERNVRHLEEELAERTARLQQKESQLFEALADLKIQRENYRNLCSQSDIREANSLRQTEVILEFQQMKDKMGGFHDSLSKQLKEQTEVKDKLLDEARKEADKLKEKLLKAESDLVDARRSSSGSAGSTANVTPTTTASSGGLCCVSYKDQLTKYQVMTKSLEHQITTEKDNSIRLEKMVRELSACLKDSQESKAILSEQLSGEVAEAQARATRLQAEKETAEEKAVQLEQRCKDLEILHKETESTLAEVRSTLEASTDRESLQRLEAEVTETRTRLEAELIAHGKAVEDLATMRLRAENAERSKDEAKQTIQAAVTRLEQEASVHRDEANRLRNENLYLNERLEEHQKRYDELLTRLGPSDDGKSQATTLVGVSGTSSMGALETSELTSVVDFLRSEGKLKAAELDKLRAENERLKTKYERTQELLRKAEADRASQETDTRVFLSAEKHAELVKKVELCQVYQESNRLLRQELDAARASSISGTSQSGSEADIEILTKENEILKREVKSWQQRLQKATLQVGQAVVAKEIEEKAKRAEERAIQAETEGKQAKEEKAKAEEDAKKKDEIIEQLKRLGRKYKQQYTEKEKETAQKVKEIEEKQKELATVQEKVTRLQSELESERARLEAQRHEQHLRENTIRSQFEGKWRRQDEEIKALRNQIAESGSGPSNTIAATSANVADTASSGDANITSLIPSSSAPSTSSPPAQTSAPTLVVRPVPAQQPPTASIRPVVTAHRTTTGFAVAQAVTAGAAGTTGAAAPRMAEPPRAEVHPIQEETTSASVATPVSSLGMSPGPSTSSVGLHQPSTQSTQGTKRSSSAAASVSTEPDDGTAAPTEVKRVRTEAALVLPQGTSTSDSTTAGTSFVLPGGDNRAVAAAAAAEIEDVEDAGGPDVMGEEEDEGDEDSARAEAEDDELVLELANDDASSDATLPTAAVVVHQQPAQQMGLQVTGHGLQQRGAHAVVPQASSSIAVTGGTDDGIVPCTPTLVGGEDGGTSSFVFQPGNAAAASAFPSPPPGDQIAAVEPVVGNEGPDGSSSMDGAQQDAAGLEGARNVPSISSATTSTTQQNISVVVRSGTETAAGASTAPGPAAGSSVGAEPEEVPPPVQTEAGVPQRVEGQPLLPVPDQPPLLQAPIGHHQQQQGQRIRRIQAPAWQQQQQQLQQQQQAPQGGGAHPGMGVRGRGARRGGRPMQNRNIWRRQP